MGEQDQISDLQILGGQKPGQRNSDDEDDELPSLLEGIQVPTFLKNF